MTLDTDRGTLGSAILAFLAGAAVGAAVVALTTPKSGPQVRKDLRDMGERIRDRMSRYRNACRHAASDADEEENDVDEEAMVADENGTHT